MWVGRGVRAVALTFVGEKCILPVTRIFLSSRKQGSSPKVQKVLNILDGQSLIGFASFVNTYRFQEILDAELVSIITSAHQSLTHYGSRKLRAGRQIYLTYSADIHRRHQIGHW